MESSSMSSFRVDVLLKALKELQDEKSQNEQILAEECSKCKRLEVKAEAVISTLNTVSEKHAKAKESLIMEEQRVEQTQQQIHQYEEVNNGIRVKIAKLKQQIEQSKEERRANMARDGFEEEMSELRQKFLSGWKNTMESNMEDYEEQKQKLEQESVAYQNKLELLQEQIETEREQSPQQDDTVSNTKWDEVCKMFKAENLASKAALERRREELKLEDLEKKLAHLLKEKDSAGYQEEANTQREL